MELRPPKLTKDPPFHHQAWSILCPPIITTARGGNPEVVRGQGNGLVVEDPGNPEAFARAILHLLSNHDVRARMSRRGRALAEAHFGWDRVASEIRSVWEQG